MPDKARRAKPEPKIGPSDLPALRAFVGGYLHQDFVTDYKTPATALNAYCREASRKEILELENDLDSFINKTSGVVFGEARELFVRELRSGWAPPNRAALSHLLRMVRAQLSA